MTSKKLCAILTLLCFMFTLMPMAAFAADTDEAVSIEMQINSNYVTVNGETFRNDVAPILVGDRTMLPIRVIAEALGADVDWNEDLQKVTITKDGTTIQIFIGKDYALVNGENVALDAPAFIENGRTYLPIRFVAENLGANVDWYANSQRVVITTGEEATDTVTVSFDYNYSSKGIYKTVEVEKGEKVTKPESPYRSGYVFNGWYTTADAEDDELFDFYTDEVYTDMTLYARWSQSYSGGGGGSVSTHTHTEEIIPAVAATCTETGLTEGKRCSDCGKVLVAQETIDANGHSWDDGVVTIEATCTEAGEKTFTCTICQTTKTESIDVMEHNYVAVSLKTTDTGAVIGTRYVCSCGDIKEDVVTEASTVVATIGAKYFATIDGAVSNAVAEDVINVKAGSYTLPQFITDGISIAADGEVKFNLTQAEGTYYRINTNGAKFIGVTFNNPVCLTGSATFEGCTFANGTDTCTINGNTSFTRCTFTSKDDGVGEFAFHIDSGDSDAVVTVSDCKFKQGAVAFDGIGSISFNDCDFTGNYAWKYMRAYVPTTLTGCTFENGMTVKAVEDAFNAVKRVDTDVVVEYALPQFIDDDAVIGEKGCETVVTLTQAEGSYYRINTNGAKFIGVTFNNPVCLTGSATFEDCTFAKGTDTVTASDDVTFTNCTFADNGKGFALHIDSGTEEGELIVEDCEFTGGAVAFKGLKSAIFNKCDFSGNYTWKYMRVYVPTTLTNCEFACAEDVAIAIGTGGSIVKTENVTYGVSETV